MSIVLSKFLAGIVNLFQTFEDLESVRDKPADAETDMERHFVKFNLGVRKRGAADSCYQSGNLASNVQFNLGVRGATGRIMGRWQRIIY